MTRAGKALMMEHLRFFISSIGVLGLAVPLAAAKTVSVTIDAASTSDASDTLIQEPQSDLDALRMREEFTLNKPAAKTERAVTALDPAQLDPATYTPQTIDTFSTDAVTWPIASARLH